MPQPVFADPPELFLGVRVPKKPQPIAPSHKTSAEHATPVASYPLETLKKQIASEISNCLKLPHTMEVRVVHPKSGTEADLAVACHPFLSVLQKPLPQVTTEVAEYLQKKGYDATATSSGYVNITLHLSNYEDMVTNVSALRDRYGTQDSGAEKTVVIDLSSPNIAKHFSVGHLRPTMVGESLARVYDALGYSVIRDNHLGDWGTQFGMLGRAYELWKDEIPELQNSETQVQGLFKLYVKMHEEIAHEKEMHPDTESSLEQEGRDWFRRLEQKDPKAVELFQWAWKLSILEFERVYQLLGTRYDYALGESFYVDMLDDVIASLLREKLVMTTDGAIAAVFRKQKGGIWELITGDDAKDHLADDDVETELVQKKDGASLYATRDLATLIARTVWFKPESIVYVVGGDQSVYFQKVFSLYHAWAKEACPHLTHVKLGMMSLPEGKMSTRKGRVVFLEDVLSESIARARAKVEESSAKNGEVLSDAEKEDIARQVGVGAIIFFDLGQGHERSMIFDWEQALSLHQNSAPYIQYGHARARSVLRKARSQGIAFDSNVQFVESPTERARAEKDLILHLARFPEFIAQAGDMNEPSKISEYLLQLTEKFNSFYRDCPILKEENSAIQSMRLRIVEATAQVIKNGLRIICIEAPEKM